MRLMHAKNIHYSIGDRTLLHIDELAIHRSDRIGLIGENGEGKSMLLHYLMGELEGVQDVRWYGTRAYFKQLHSSTGNVSGGEFTLQELDRVFQEQAELLLLDEPTNNLDWQHVEAFEKRLLHTRQPFVIVSHDRQLLDRLCTTIWELKDGKLSIYKGNHEDYVAMKKVEQDQQQQSYEAYTKEKKRLLERARQKEQQAKGMRKPPSRMGNSEWQLHKGKAKGKQQKVERVTKVIQERLDRLEQVDKPYEEAPLTMEHQHLRPIHGTYVMTAKSLTAPKPNTSLYYIEQLELLNGKKTAIVGPNGCGKTTLIKQLLKEHHPIIWTSQARVGYFSQTLHSLPKEDTILSFIEKDSPLSSSMIRTILGRLHFYRADVHKSIDVLSGGERVKVALAKLVTGDYNILVLDEPTNHLDIEAIEALEKLLIAYNGTVLFVSHDRRFVDRVADSLWTFQDNTVHMFQGSLSEWKEHVTNPPMQDEATYDLLTLETKLSELISRISVPAPGDDSDQLEQEYQMVLAKIRQLKSK
ncbi:ABC transporter [Pontibacillus halophilus JSM 076056 = DSM 19796]|uniref:ABC transporter n=1 Tax=Pontibacillus halophilus JSM 076056 = DSM 19796 TaxID=1385510 RepID=A0A0A5GMC6_9BACI|nr:ATP-binding cassette domain-containing protein [Pontibacillus halophilus]KGX92320.1 ABC transporter [Pontibacillus halophilus JSM 076056 = DSM 19796]